MDTSELSDALRLSLLRQQKILRASLVLNPVENFPFPEDIEPLSGILHGLYNTDKIRSDKAKKETIHQFAGRDRLAYDSRKIYDAWAKALGAADVSLRLLSGLQAHSTIFMAISKPGDKVLLLPELAGGHMATKGILERLGLEVIEMEVDFAQHAIDVEATLSKIENDEIDFVFIDRSEGLVYEDFTPLIEKIDAPTVFDGSQYLSQILTGDYMNPFDMGSDIFVSTVHKNFPGPQKALVGTREDSQLWHTLRSGLSAYVSNMHIASTYAAGLTLSRVDWLKAYSAQMLENTISLERALEAHQIPIIKRRSDAPPTHHIWIGPLEKDMAFLWFKRLEMSRVQVNYRLLPYHLGYGLRLGLAALTRLGARPEDCLQIAKLINMTLREQPNSKQQVRQFSEELWSREVK